MARKKRTSPVIEVAQRRLAGLKSIDTEFDLGADMTKADFERRITGLINRLNLYNQHSAELDQEQNDLNKEEKITADWSKRWLAATGAKFGTDSNEYEAVGGTRTSERKKGKRGGSGDTGGTPKP
jgi:hypothetical protein